MSHVKIRNQKTGGVWLCPEGAVDDYLANGWQRAAKSAEPTNDTGAAPVDEASDK